LNNIKRIAAKFNLETIIIASLLIALFIWFVLVIVATNKGFNISDEGLYMYYFSLAENSKTTINFTSFHVFQNSLFPFLKPTIQNLRLERLFLSILVSIVLFFSSVKFLSSKFNIALNIKNKFVLLIMLLMGVTSSYIFAPQTISYNIFSSLLLAGSLAIILYEFSYKSNIKRSTKSGLLIGLAISMLVLVKISNSLLIFIVYLLITLINDYLNSSQFKLIAKLFIIRLASIVFAFFSFQLIVWGSFNNFFSFLEQTQAAIALLSNHTISNLLIRYVDAIPYLLEILLFNHYIILFITTVSLLYLISKKHIEAAWLMLAVHIYIVFHYDVFIAGGTYTPLQTIYYIIWMLAFISIPLFNFKAYRKLNKHQIKQFFYVLTLLIFPLIGIIGTDNFLHIQLSFYLISWFLLVFIVFQTFKNTLFKNTTLALFCMFSMYQMYTSIYINPYLLNKPLAEQNKKLVINKSEFIYTTKQFKEEVESIKSTLINNGFKKGDYIFTYSEMVGLGYLLNAKFPTNNTCWFRSNDDESNMKILDDFFQSHQGVKLFFIIDDRAPYSSQLTSFFANNGYQLDVDYRKVLQQKVHFNKEAYEITVLAPKKLK